MSVEKQIAVIGVSDEETAHLRLLMRKAAAELSHRWKWGTERGADLIVVDLSSFAGQMARTRAQAAGMRVAVFSDEPVDGADLALQRPLKVANVVTVLNLAANAVVRVGGMADGKHDFYFRDVGEVDHAAHVDASPLPSAAASPPYMNDAAPGLEDLLRFEPDAKAAMRVDVKLGDETTVFGTSGPTARSDARVRDVHETLGRPRSSTSDAPPPRRAALGDTARHSLRQYLDEELLGGPARIVLPDAPPLVLDPKCKMFHSPARLAALEPYCRTALRLCDWQPLTTADLTELRIAEPPQPYLRLIWLYVLVHSEGQLARHLDPGGTYRLVRWIEIERDFSSYFRIASSMLAPARLHEIAAASGASMADVFDAVNAYDAIGLIEWTPRPPRNDPGAEKNRAGLLQRLRGSFRKS